jgi:hypothetical protein
VDEQPGFVVEGARVALGPLRMDLVATYQRWEHDLEVANANRRVLPFTLEAERERSAGRNGKPEFCDFTLSDRADQPRSAGAGCWPATPQQSRPVRDRPGERRGHGLGTEATGSRSTGLQRARAAQPHAGGGGVERAGDLGLHQGRLLRGGAPPRRGLTMGRRHDGVFMDLLASEFLHAGGSVLAGRAPPGLRPASR